MEKHEGPQKMMLSLLYIFLSPSLPSLALKHTQNTRVRSLTQTDKVFHKSDGNYQKDYEFIPRGTLFPMPAVAYHTASHCQLALSMVGPWMGDQMLLEVVLEGQ
jgi:hypothetical protein